MRRLAFISLPLWVALGVAATSVLLFYRLDRRTHEANLAKLAPIDRCIPPAPHRSATAPRRLDQGKAGHRKIEA